MSRAGRKRKKAAREKSGRVQRATTRKARQVDLRALTAAQPHRNGSLDQRRRWAIGRLILDGKARSDTFEPAILERAAELYAKTYANMRWVMDSRRPYAKLTAGSGQPSDEEAQTFIAAWSRVCAALRAAGNPNVEPYKLHSNTRFVTDGERIQKAAEIAILDDPQDEAVLAPWIILSLPTALEALAVHYGLGRR